MVEFKSNFLLGMKLKMFVSKEIQLTVKLWFSIPSLTQMFKDVSCNDNIEICRAIVRDENNFHLYIIYINTFMMEIQNGTNKLLHVSED